jgi:hypothetical protein
MSGDVTVPCPICDFPVTTEETGCPRCREERSLKRRPLYLAAAVLAGLGALSFGRISRAWDDFQSEVERVRLPPKMRYVSDEKPAPASGDAGVAITSSAYVYQPQQVFAPAPSPAPRPAVTAVAAAVTPAPPPAAPPSTIEPMERPSEGPAIPMRRLYGVVYDIESLRPVSGAQVKFSVSGGDLAWSTKTDQRGHYQIDVIENPRNVMLVSAEAPGYRKGALEDSDPPLRLSKAKRRRSLVEETTDHDLAESIVRLGGSDNIIQFDLVVFPERPR